MKILVAVVFTVLFIPVHAQDTVYLRGEYPVIVKVLETVEDEYVEFRKLAAPNLSKQRIKLAEVKMIKYQNGWIDTFKTDTKYIYDEALQLIDSKIIRCKVMAVNEDENVIIDTDSSYTPLAIPYDSVASITYRTGLIEQYNEVVTSKADVVQIDNANTSTDSVKTAKFYNKLITYNNSNDELTDAKGSIEEVKALFDRVVSKGNYDSLDREIILEYCKLFDEVYFTGKKQDGLPAGKGELYKPGGEIQSGEFVNGKLSGAGKIIRNSVVEREGEFNNGELNGRGTIIDSRGRVIEGMFINNQLSGPGSITFKSGAFEKGNYLKSRLSGEGERHLQNKNFYKGTFKNSKYDGYGMYHWQDQNVFYEGNFTDGKRNGEGQLKLPDGTIISGVWKNDCAEGEMKIKKQADTPSKYYTAAWVVKDSNIESKKNIDGKVVLDESLLFIKMTGY